MTMNDSLTINTRKTSLLINLVLSVIFFSTFTSTAIANDAVTAEVSSPNKWTPSKQKDGISSYTRAILDSKYKAVRGETILPVSTARLFAAINDAPACPEWADTCKESYIHQEISKHEFFIYTLNDLPWPVKDRDVLAHVEWTQDSEGAIVMHSKAVKNKVAKIKGTVRIELATAQWRFMPLDDGRTAASFEIHMDPNGNIPSWLLNRLILNSPFSTFDNLAKQAAKEKYADATLPFSTQVSLSPDSI
jgi:ribosome-associated toxin RatA of RatAB toxin-antitoxin module